jgi:probable rRNA maturation factor
MRSARVAQIEIQIAVARRGVPHASKLRAWASAVLPSSQHALCIRVVGTAESRQLNKQWRGKDKPTNVLSFPALANPESRITRHALLGDLAICAPVVAREAREQDKPLSAHWAHMVVHGVLHLVGYDHVKTRDAEQMEAREAAVLVRFGYSDPYRSA